jgi:hypothetical protein
VNDEQPDHNDGGPTGTLVVWPVIGKAGNDGSNDEMAKCHADGTDDKDWLTTPAIHVHNGGNYTCYSGNSQVV